ncbi:MAG: bifunctional adenosylcobinamide kinase/adenosylcobinamide-phosphate guanylyltransferase [endosymbiont of Galathealinum brachiosum]|uniref:Bifunctional adenosylcobalamin biosynthesis protein n=1 Tax=endosymbiont of Galathealinum brachiosum TaxID=2200906 RepID=A0A370DAI0_9GAMM|nr:MAG: bifunctional adenosylcobinamide kinase/adenosylcobinamide-phosphate guanylyltransferase [endosymbiont of Galathealinum brachiosum]
MKQFILGGARSGKSTYAEQLAKASDKKVIYIATATAGDEEMSQRIRLHQQQRPEHWQLIEEPVNLPDVLIENNNPGNCLLIDCLTLWLSNCMAIDDEDFVLQKQNELINVITELKSDLILVSNEVGQGIVPMSELGRKFVDESGRLHQKIAQVCERVVFITAGLPQVLK